MLRPLTVFACLALAGGIASADERVALRRASDHLSEHEAIRDADPDESLAQLKAALVAIRDSQKQVREDIDKLRWDYPPGSIGVYSPDPPFPDPVLGGTDTIVLQKGQKATVTQSISWNRYESDDLLIWFRASDDSLTVPYNIEVNFERHQFRFSYEIKAGQKAGEFTVTLTPTPGKAVEVKVIVR